MARRLGLTRARITHPAYVGSPDTTLAGSRSGIAPVVLWDYLARHSNQSQMSEHAQGAREGADVGPGRAGALEGGL